VVLYKLIPVPEDFGLTPEEVRRIEAHGGAEHPRTMVEELRPYLRGDVIFVCVAMLMMVLLTRALVEYEDKTGHAGETGWEEFLGGLFFVLLILGTRYFLSWALQQVSPITAAQRDKYAAYQAALEEWRAFKNSAPSAPSTPSQES